MEPVYALFHRPSRQLILADLPPTYRHEIVVYFLTILFFEDVLWRFEPAVLAVFALQIKKLLELFLVGFVGFG